MKPKKAPCAICDPGTAREGEYCERHHEELHRLNHQYETLFRLQRVSRGKGHESYQIYVQGDCDPTGRVLITETDPENLSITVLINMDLDLDARLSGYDALNIEKTYGDQLRERIQIDIVQSWYGNARACIEVYRVAVEMPLHWDIEALHEGAEDDDSSELHPGPGSKHSVH